MTDKKKVPCPICGELFDPRGLNGHIRTHKTKNTKTPPDRRNAEHLRAVQPDGSFPDEQDEDINFIFDEQEEPEQNQEGDTKFKCECGTTLSEGQNPCPGCGGVFEWD